MAHMGDPPGQLGNLDGVLLARQSRSEDLGMRADKDGCWKPQLQTPPPSPSPLLSHLWLKTQTPPIPLHNAYLDMI